MKRREMKNVSRSAARGSSGFTFVEIAVALAIILAITAVGLTAYDYFIVKGRDDQRKLDLSLFAQKIEYYKSQRGRYICGDTCYGSGANGYSYDCSDRIGDVSVPGNGYKLSGFLNGGNCCPDPVPDEASNWGLYYERYLSTSCPKDPFNRKDSLTGKSYYYCYATPIDGQGSFALFARLERDDAGAHDGGSDNNWYELRSADYPSDGWTPSMVNLEQPVGSNCSTGFPATCGDLICEEGETCETCSNDCGQCYCGDSWCNGGEFCGSCPQDCGACPTPCPPNDSHCLQPNGGF